MLLNKFLSVLGAFVICTAGANATTIVNLNASYNAPNAGHSSPGYAFNPIVVNLAPGTYQVGVVGIAGGGIYDGYAVYSPSPTNAAYTDSYWTVSSGGVDQTQFPNHRFNDVASAMSFYSAMTPFTFTVSALDPTALFYVDDSSFPYFADNPSGGGVSLGINRVPEPLPLSLMAAGVAAFAISRRRSRAA